MIGLPSRPIFGRRGQTKAGVSGSGGDPFPKPKNKEYSKSTVECQIRNKTMIDKKNKIVVT